VGEWRVGVGTDDPGAELHVMGDIIGRSISKTRTITKGASLSDETETFTLNPDENRIVLNNNQGSIGSTRIYRANFTSGVPTTVGTVLHLEINSQRVNTDGVGRGHQSVIQFDGTSILDTGYIVLGATGGNDSYDRQLQRTIILTDDGWKDYSMYPKISAPTTDDAIIFSTTEHAISTDLGNTELTERMRITNTGNVGIGTTDPGTKLSISSPNTNGATLQLRNKLTAAIEETASYAHTNIRQKPDINNNDRTLQFESYPYGAAGQNIMQWLAWNSSNDGWLTPMRLTSSGNLTISGTYSPSDDRLKTNEAYIENATETLLKLKPQKYDKHNYSFLEVTPETYSNSIDGNVFIEAANIWVDANTFTYSTTDNVWYKRTLSDVTHEEAGLIAQDIWYDTPELRYIVSIPNDAQIPETKPEVSDDPTIDPDYENWGRKNATVNYTYLIPYLIKSNQELHTELQTVKARLDTLENAS
jgi:hypothetical protein